MVAYTVVLLILLILGAGHDAASGRLSGLVGVLFLLPVFLRVLGLV